MRVTQAQVARAAKVTQSAVSLALRNHPSIPKGTRERIQRLAVRLGYHPDPMLAALASYRQKQHTPAFHGSIGFLVSASVHARWRSEPACWRLLDGAQDAATALGYRVDFHEFAPELRAQRALAKTLIARGIRGLLLYHLPHRFEELETLVGRFLTVSLFTHSAIPGHQVVVSNHFEAIRQAYAELSRHGYQRPCLALAKPLFETVADSWIAAMHLESKRRFHCDPLIRVSAGDSFMDDASFFPWARQERIDSIIFCGGEQIVPWLEHHGFEVPGTIGLCCLDLRNPASGVSGIYQDWRQIGETAARWLHSLLITDGDGLTPNSVSLQLEGHWNKGRTLPDRAG